MSALLESLSANWKKVKGYVSGQLSAGKDLMKEEHFCGTHCSLQEKTNPSARINSCNADEFWAAPAGVMLMLSIPLGAACYCPYTCFLLR